MGFLSIVLFLQIAVDANQVVIKPAEMNLGYFAHDEAIKLTFDIYNKSRYPVRILKVMPFCSCFKIDGNDTIIFPFSKARTTFTFNSTGMSGRFHKQILIRTDRFGYQYLKFSLSGTVCNPPTRPTTIHLNNGFGRVMIDNSFWSGEVNVVSKPSCCWVGLRKIGEESELRLITHRPTITGGVKLAIGRKLITLSIKNEGE